MSGRKGMKNYPVEVKLEAVRLFFEAGKTRREIAKILRLRSDTRVQRWVRQFRREGEAAFIHPLRRPRKGQDPQSRIRQLEMEVALLKKYHTELRKSLLARRNIGSSSTTGRNTR